MTTLSNVAQGLLREAAEWRLTGLLLECPNEGWLQRVEELAREARDPDLLEAARLAREQASEGLYHSTFGPGGPAPPREATHRDTLQLGYLMSELEAFYSSFGYQPSTGEPPDHIAVEAGFLSYLSLKEAYAECCGDRGAAAIAAEAGREFRQEHLASTAEPMTAMLVTSGIPYLAAAGRALTRRAGPAKKQFLVLGADSFCRDGDESFECGDPGGR